MAAKGNDKADGDPLAETLAATVPEFSVLPQHELDLLDKAAPPPEIMGDVQPQTSEPPWNAEKFAGQVQSQLAFRLIWVLIGVLLGGGALFATTKWSGLMPKDVTAFFGVAFGAVVTLATAATSFWFGSQRGRSGNP